MPRPPTEAGPPTPPPAVPADPIAARSDAGQPAHPQPPQSPVPAVVTMHLWRVPSTAVPRVIGRMARDRGRVRRTPGVTFAKLLGTGHGRTFTPRDADPHLWGLLACWSDTQAADDFTRSALIRGWDGLATERWRATLRPVSSRGRWSGREPFGRPEPHRTDGPVAAITRARLSWRRQDRFWAAVPPVAAALHDAPGLALAIGIGEAPVGLQGTFSLWHRHRDLAAFAYRGAAHRAVAERTPQAGWYVEDLFARFAVLDSAGTVNGLDPLSTALSTAPTTASEAAPGDGPAASPDDPAGTPR